MNQQVCVPQKFIYEHWNLNFIVFTCLEGSFIWFCSTNKNVKAFFSSRLYKNKQHAGFDLWAAVCWDLLRWHCCSVPVPVASENNKCLEKIKIT